VNCPSCGAEVPDDAGFCRGCGAILGGKYARAAAAVSSPAPHPSAQPSGVVSSAAKAGEPRRARPSSPAGGDRMLRVMSALDSCLVVSGVIVLVSLAIVWYTKSVVTVARRVTLERHLLSGNAGIQRWLVPIVAVSMIVEALVNLRRLSRWQHDWRRHRGVAVVLALANFVLVVSCMATSPFGGETLANLGVQFAVGPGGWVALGGAIVGIVVGTARMFVGAPALGRSAPRR